MGAKITAALADCPATGCVIDARGFTGAQTGTTTITVNKPAMIEVCGVTYTSSASPGIDLTVSNSGILGCNRGNTSLKTTAGAGAVVVRYRGAAVPSQLRNVFVEGVTLDGNSQATSVGLELLTGPNASPNGQTIINSGARDLYITGTTADGISVGTAALGLNNNGMQASELEFRQIFYGSNTGNGIRFRGRFTNVISMANMTFDGAEAHNIYVEETPGPITCKECSYGAVGASIYMEPIIFGDLTLQGGFSETNGSFFAYGPAATNGVQLNLIDPRYTSLALNAFDFTKPTYLTLSGGHIGCDTAPCVTFTGSGHYLRVNGTDVGNPTNVFSLAPGMMDNIFAHGSTTGITYFDGPVGINTRNGVYPVGSATEFEVRGTIQATDGLTSAVLAPPAAPVITHAGTAGTQTWGYMATCRTYTQDTTTEWGGTSLVSSEGTTTTGNATLTAGNYNIITVTYKPGCKEYGVYRSTSGGTPATLGLIGTVAAPTVVTPTIVFNDTGLGITALVPPVDSTGTANFVHVTTNDSRPTYSNAINAGNSPITVNAHGILTRGLTTIRVRKEFWIANAPEENLGLVQLPARTRLVAVYADVTEAYAKTGTIAMLIGTSTTTCSGQNDIMASFDVKTAIATKGLLDADMATAMKAATFVQGAYIPSWTAASTVCVQLVAGTGTLGDGTVTNLTAGDTTFYIITERLP